MVNVIAAEAFVAFATVVVATPAVLGINGVRREDGTQCQTIGQYLGQAARGQSPDYARIRQEQTRERIMGKMGRPSKG